MKAAKTRHCRLKAGHAGPHRWGGKNAGWRRAYTQALSRGITPTDPPCIGGLIERREAEVRHGYDQAHRTGAR